MTNTINPTLANLHAPFLATICERADEDGPRLVYADWLEEQGDSDRSELIRVQVALSSRNCPDRHRSNLCAMNPVDPLCERCKYGLLEIRSAALLAAHGRVWAAPLMAVLPKCERCKGDGIAAPYTDNPCPTCHGSGSPVAVEWSGGFVERLAGHPCKQPSPHHADGVVCVCGGSGRTGGVDAAAWVGERCEQCVNMVFDMLCPRCKGAKYIGSLAAAVARLIPLRGVEFAGKRPYLAAAGDYYFWVDVETTVTREGATARLPPQLFEQLKDGVTSVTTGFRYYPDPVAALTDLSDAGASFARKAAKLPDLEKKIQ